MQKASGYAGETQAETKPKPLIFEETNRANLVARGMVLWLPVSKSVYVALILFAGREIQL